MKPELIAPAGDLEKLKIAFQYGADAVYASTPQFSMRTREIGFNYDTLKEGMEYAHNLGKKVYVTINIYPHPGEIDNLQKHILNIIALKPDAIISADPGVISFIKNHTNIPIHLSTQANATNQLAINFWAKQGIERVVLARELSLKEIKTIHDSLAPQMNNRQTEKQTADIIPPNLPFKSGGIVSCLSSVSPSSIHGVQLEAFVHGAMCMAYSGRCQISNYMTGRDPNRGACIQACRFRYKLATNGQQTDKPTDNGQTQYMNNSPSVVCRQLVRHPYLEDDYPLTLEEELRPGEEYPIMEDERGTYILNSKDLCMIENIDKLVEAGVSSFKLEGRLKSIYYVGCVTKAYREAIDLYFEDPAKYQKEKNRLQKDLEKVSNRHYTTGFYFHKPDSQTNNYESSKPANDWGFVGLVKGYNDENKRVIIEAKNYLPQGAQGELVTPTEIHKITLSEIWHNGEKTEVTHANHIIEVPFKKPLEPSSFLRIKADHIGANN